MTNPLTPATQAYNTLHAKIRRERGRVHGHACVDCGGPARDWSHRHDTDQLDSANYDPRCRRCHLDYDGIHTRGEACSWAKLTEADVEQIRAMVATGTTQREVGTLFGVSQQQVSKIVRRLRWV